MPLFKNHWFRWFVGAFIIGAALPAAASATNYFKDLEVTSGKFNFSGASAWGAATLLCGVCSGVLGLGGAALKGNRKSAS